MLTSAGKKEHLSLKHVLVVASYRKHLCWSLFLGDNIAKFLRAPILNNIYERLLLKVCS